MFWDLVQLILLVVFMLAYIACLYQDNVLIRHREKIHTLDCQVIDAQRRVMEANTELQEALYCEVHELMGDVVLLETERDHYLRRCVVLEDENDKLKKSLELQGIEYPKETKHG